MENLYCLRCNRELELGHKSVAVYMFAQTVGIRPRQKSSAQRICFCPQCSVSLAMGPPPEGALNIAAWNMIRDLVGSDPALNQAAWENLRGIVGLLSAGDAESRPRRAAAGGATSSSDGRQPVGATIHVGAGAARQVSIRHPNPASCARSPGRGVRAYVRRLQVDMFFCESVPLSLTSGESVPAERSLLTAFSVSPALPPTSSRR